MGWFAALAVMGLFLLWLEPIDLQRAVARTEIFQGVWYSCDDLGTGDEARGLVHLLQVDLSAPGIDLFVTPVDPGAMAREHQYRLAFAGRVAREHELAAVINGTLFSASSSLPLPGSLADSNETLIAQGHVNHVHSHSYLLWFDEGLGAKLEVRKPPPASALSHAQWGISGQGVALHGGMVPTHVNGTADRRTALGVNPASRTLWLAVFEHASGRVVAQTLADAGATEAIIVDGGDSTTMLIGSQSSGLNAGTLLGGRRPVATFFGLRALPLLN